MKARKSFFEFIQSPPANLSGFWVFLLTNVVINLIAGILVIVLDNEWLSIVLWIIVFVVLTFLAYSFQKRQKPWVLVPENERPKKHKGLIVLVGPGAKGVDSLSQSAGKAIEYHLSTPMEPGLMVCWLIASEGLGGSYLVAEELSKMCKKFGVKPLIRTIKDAYSNIQETYELVQSIYFKEVPEVGLSEEEVIADFTGGTKPMSAGMILACGDQRTMQYMYGRVENVVSTPRLMKYVPQKSRAKIKNPTTRS